MSRTDRCIRHPDNTSHESASIPWKTIRGNNDINVLWELFGQVKEGKVDERLFQTALNIKSVGKGKLSIVLFYANPERYVPLDSNTSSYLRSKKLGYTYDSFASYNELSEKIVKTLGKRPWEISYEAYNYTPESDSSSIGSIRTLFEKLEDELEDDMDYHIFYRGQSDKSFGLIPSSISREILKSKMKIEFSEILSLKVRLISKGVHLPLRSWSRCSITPCRHASWILLQILW